MGKHTAFLVLMTLPSLASCTGVGGPQNAGPPTVQAEAMQHMMIDVHQIRGYVYGGTSLAEADAAAVDLLSYSRRMAELFPPGQATTDYVDMSPARVSGAPLAMSRTAERLMAAVQTGKRPLIGDQLVRTEREGCGFCHLSASR